LVESARIARGKIQPLSAFEATQFDALIFPGGSGCIKNLSSFAFKGVDCSVNKEVERVIKDMVSADKPVGALCIAPAFVVSTLKSIDITIGNDEQTAHKLEKMGARHHITHHGAVVKDRKLKVFTTPCYMLDANIAQIADGTENIVKAMIDAI